MPVRTATMQVCAFFSAPEGYVHVNSNPAEFVTLVTGRVFP